MLLFFNGNLNASEKSISSCCETSEVYLASEVTFDFGATYKYNGCIHMYMYSECCLLSINSLFVNANKNENKQ